MFCVSLPVAADSLVLGVLDRPQCDMEAKTSGRLLFVKVGNRWIGLNNEHEAPKNLNLNMLNWTVAFDGRNIGNVTLRDPNPTAPTSKDWYFARDKLYEPVDTKNVPTTQNKEGRFGGWCQTPAVRPLVLVSKPNFSDPDKWKPFTPDTSYTKRLHAALKLVVGRFNAARCSKGATHAEPWDYKPDDLIIYSGYRSNSGKELVSIGIDRKKIGCEYVAEAYWSNHWFLIEGENLEFLGTQMELVDAGDYDKDGHSEILFWHNGYNRNGYLLVFDGMRQKIEYIWSYH